MIFLLLWATNAKVETIITAKMRCGATLELEILFILVMTYTNGTYFSAKDPKGKLTVYFY